MFTQICKVFTKCFKLVVQCIKYFFWTYENESRHVDSRGDATVFADYDVNFNVLLSYLFTYYAGLKFVITDC